MFIKLSSHWQILPLFGLFSLLIIWSILKENETEPSNIGCISAFNQLEIVLPNKKIVIS